MRRFLMAALAALLVLVLVAPVASAGLRDRRTFGPTCYTAPHQRSAMVDHAQYVLANYDVIAPEDAGASALTRDIVKADYFGNLACFVTLVEKAIRNEVRRNQPLEDADAAVAWFHALVALRT